MRGISGRFFSRASRTRQCLGWKETFPELVHFSWKMVVPALEVVTGVLAKLTELAEGGITIRHLLSFDKEAILLECVFQLLLYE